jgi:hypothetical protein
MKACENDGQRVSRELSELNGIDRFATFDAKRLERDLVRRLTEWRELLKRQTPIARQVLSKLLEGKIAWTSHHAERIYTFEGRARFDRILAGIVDAVGMVPVRGFEPRSRG